MDQTLSEKRAVGAVEFEIINSGLRTVTITSYLETASPRFGPDDSGDVAYDAIQIVPNRRLQCSSNSGLIPLVGLSLAFRQSCSALVEFAVIDNDPFDTFNPVVDFADWAVLLQVSAKDAFDGDPVSDEIGHAYVRVVDDPNPIPELGTSTLVSSGIVAASLLYKRRRSRLPVQ